MPETLLPDDIRNRILRALPATELARLLPRLERVALERGQVIHQPGARVKRIYFINSGLITLIKTMRDGRTAMIGTRGIEGLTTPGALFAANPTNVESIVQIPGIALATNVKALRKLMSESAVLRNLLGAYGWLVVGQFVQVSACNRLHSLEQRCAKLLLTCYDNVPADSFELTHEFLSMTLGVQRSRISIVAGLLQRANLIEYKHGHIRISDPKGLKALACECYELIKTRNDDLFAPGAR